MATMGKSLDQGSNQREHPKKVTVDDIVALRQQGLNTSAIAEQLGIPQSAVMNALRWGF